VTLAYFAVATLAIQLTGQAGNVAALWFAGAVLLAALMRHEPSAWPALLLLGLVADLAASLFNGSRPPVALAVASADVLEVLLAAAALRRLAGDGPRLASAGWMGLFALAALLAPAAAAALGAGLLALLGEAPFAVTWPLWFAADALGLLIATPFLLSWTDPELRPDGSARALLTALLLGGLVLAVALLVFVRGGRRLPVPDLPGPAAGHLRRRAAGRHGRGGRAGRRRPVVHPGGEGPIVALAFPVTDVVARVQAMQLYLAAVLLSSLPVALVLAQREAIAARLREAGEAAEAARREAERSGRAKGDFLATMSHEIRTPVTGLLGMAGLLEAEELSARQRRYLKAILTSGRQLLHIINDILDFSRFEAGKVELEAADFRLADVLEDVASVMTPQAAEKGLALELDTDEGLPPVLRGDPTRLRQVLFNLVGNALKFTHRGGIIVSVGHRPEDEEGRVRLRVEVRDTGIGIPKEKQAALFRPFVQAEGSTARVYGGSGLGLAISKRLVEAMGGAIGVESVPGVGSCFWFEAPLGVGDEAALAAAPEAADLAGVRPLRVLLAEDIELNRDLLGEMLGRHGHEVVFAEDGGEAVGLGVAGRVRPGADGHADAVRGRGRGDAAHPAARGGGRRGADRRHHGERDGGGPAAVPGGGDAGLPRQADRLGEAVRGHGPPRRPGGVVRARAGDRPDRGGVGGRGGLVARARPGGGGRGGGGAAARPWHARPARGEPPGRGVRRLRAARDRERGAGLRAAAGPAGGLGGAGARGAQPQGHLGHLRAEAGQHRGRGDRGGGPGRRGRVGAGRAAGGGGGGDARGAARGRAAPGPGVTGGRRQSGAGQCSRALGTSHYRPGRATVPS
jgi:signal transduction histidine kinase